jgi:hypothetical protein
MHHLYSSEAKELHVVSTSDGNSVTNILRIDALHIWSVDGPGVATLRIVRLCALGLVVVVSENTSPLLHSLLVVLRAQSSIGASMVDLHLRAAAVVAGGHVGDDLGPSCRSRGGCALGTGAVPCVDAARVGHEAASSDTRIGNGGLEKIRVGSSHDVL